MRRRPLPIGPVEASARATPGRWSGAEGFLKAWNRNSGKELGWRVSIADTLLARTRGLLGRAALAQGEGLLIRPCTGVHTFLMKFPIDVVFLDRDNRVIKTVANLKPHRMTRLMFSARGVLELPAGTVSATGTTAGDEVIFEPHLP